MRIKQMARWCLRDLAKSFGIFFAAFAGVLLLIRIIVFTVVVPNSEEMNISFGLGSSTVFLFICGIISFSMYLKVGIANGVSRRSTFFGIGLCSLVLSVLATFAEHILTYVFFFSLNGGVPIESLLLTSGSGNIFGSILLSFCINLAVMGAGLFIGGAYYRMNRMVRLLVSVFVPLLILAGTPIIINFFPAAADFIAGQIIAPIFRFALSSFWNGSLCLLICSAVVFPAVWLLMRRAPIKSNAK